MGTNINNFKDLYQKLLAEVYKNKPFWEHIRDKELTIAPAFVGDYYEKSNGRLMVVGRAVNGWEVDIDGYQSLDASVNSTLKQTNPFLDVVNGEGIKSEELGTKYFYKRSKYWKLIKYVLEKFNDSNPDIWYEDDDTPNRTHWSEKIVWSNLYKIAPRFGGNPTWGLVKPQMQAYINIVKWEIDFYKPNNILFVTDNDFFVPWANQPAFKDIMTTYTVIDDNGVVAYGKYNDINYVVCKRPDKRTVKDEYIHLMADTIFKYFK